MKKIILTLVMMLSATVASAEVRLHGQYKTSSFSSVDGELVLMFKQNQVYARIAAPQSDCVLRFAKGHLISHDGAEALYSLPVTEACAGPRGFGSYRTLSVEINNMGQVIAAKIFGSNGKMSWTYFRSR